MIHGVITALFTPMHDDETVNHDRMKIHVRRQLAGGVHGLFVAGTNGEGYALSMEEKLNLAQIVTDEVNGKVPVFFGSGMCTTRDTIVLSKKAEQMGVDALSVVCPYFAPVSQDAVYAHFYNVAASVNLPIVLYNIPARTGVNLLPDTVARLAQVPNIVGIKDSSGNFEQILQYRECTPKDFSVLSGNDSLLLWTLLSGGSGGICGVANIFPSLMASIYEKWKNGDIEGAKACQEMIRPFRSLFRHGSSIAIIKMAANIRGMHAGPVRKPFAITKDGVMEEVELLLNSMYRGIDE